MPVDRQILLIFLETRCYRNRTSSEKIAVIARLKHDTIESICCPVITATQTSNLRIDDVKLSRVEEKETAKK